MGPHDGLHLVIFRRVKPFFTNGYNRQSKLLWLLFLADCIAASTAILRPSTCCAKFTLDTQGQIAQYSSPLEASSYQVKR